ncbi:MAG TPA: hypothetical protein VGP28_04915 [Methylocella sp.]|jgi:hypothetical protein|nr:hypothetical protein [Methylocella sp.]
MLKRFLLYGFPLYLLCIEYFVKFLLAGADGSDSLAISSTAPTIAAAGLSLLMPIVIPKPVPEMSEAVRKQYPDKKITIIGQADQHLINSAWIFIFVIAALWGYSLYLNEKHIESVLPGIHLRATWIIGLASYIVGVVHTEIKEVV